MINHKQDPPNKGKAEQPTEKTTHTHRARKDQQDTDSRKGEGGISQQYVNMLFVRGILKISTGPRTLHIIFNTQDEALLSPPRSELANFLASHKHSAHFWILVFAKTLRRTSHS